MPDQAQEPIPEPPMAPAEPIQPIEPIQPAPEPTTLIAQPDSFRGRWEDIQAVFVDEPRQAVESADQLVVEVIDEITAVLVRERDEVASRWRGDADTSTEDLRQAFQDYRSVFDRLLSV